jgi:RNA 3'-terminal phosphate cyclase (ATP)
MIEIDGSTGEGGGQLLRIAVALSALKGIPVRIRRIRSGRPNPGLAAQHVAAVRAVAALASAEVDGLEPGSAEISFRPGTLVGGKHAFDVGTAGSVTLVLQACLPVALASPEGARITLTGGTDVQWSPPLDYFARVFLPLLRRMGGAVDLLTERRGYYPRGGGQIEVVVQPTAKFAAVPLSEAGPVQRVRGIAHVSNLPDEIPRRMKASAVRRIHGIEDVTIEERTYRGEEAIGQGGAVVLWADMERTGLGSSSLAERGKSSERVGEEAAESLAAEIVSGATLDVHAADQLLVYLAQTGGSSSFYVREATGHLRTMAWLVPLFLPVTIVFQPVGGLTRVKIVPKP